LIIDSDSQTCREYFHQNRTIWAPLG
jgi:hypothetical protein